jgi:hypothetical protein
MKLKPRSFIGRVGQVPRVMKHHYLVCRRHGAARWHAIRVAFALAWLLVTR